MTNDFLEEYSKVRVRVIPDQVVSAEEQIAQMMRMAPIPDNELAENVPLFFSPRVLKRVLFMDELYRQILPVHGVILQFGVRWGRDIAVLDALRHIYEPFNITRTVVGFDTFEGFPAVHERDGQDVIMRKGSYTTTDNYPVFLQNITDCRQRLDPLPHIVHCQIVQGDVTVELPRWLEANPQAIVALAHFDMDIYEPTKVCLELLRERCTRGTILAFDELNSKVCPGETVALREVFGLDRYRIQRSPTHSGQGSYLVID
ncbi:MAG: crotonobetainyl-CoA--carnitine CoA-transferase [Magnetococcales bacterium]|nr:crotonobetainyl-CoA--carnitine CoA-transferase [Magnetococcales bacterium]